MKTTEQQIYPGQAHALNLKRASVLVAKDGAMHVEYRDGSLDWLQDAAPAFSVELPEGAQYVLPCDAFVKIQAEGAQAVNYVIMPSRSLMSRLLAWMSMSRPRRQVPSSAQPRKPDLPARSMAATGQFAGRE